MKDMLRRMRFLREVGMCVLFVMAVCGTARGQDVDVTGRVTSEDGSRLPAVTVRIRGTNTSTVTDAEGKYFITAPADGVLLFNRIGYRGVGQSIGKRTTIDVALERAISVLPEVVVTGYTSQKRADITGAVAIANVESIERQTSTSVLQRLDGRVPGVTVDASGSPGSRSTVRIRGFTSFQNNDPLYIWPNNCGPKQAAGLCTSVDENSYAFPNTLIMRGSPGTDWWKAVFSPAAFADANLGVSGGGEDHAYNVSFNYLNQDGTAAYTRFQRGTLRGTNALRINV